MQIVHLNCLIIALFFAGAIHAQIFKATDTLQTSYNNKGCGLNYTQVSVVLGQKWYSMACPFLELSSRLAS